MGTEAKKQKTSHNSREDTPNGGPSPWTVAFASSEDKEGSLLSALSGTFHGPVAIDAMVENLLGYLRSHPTSHERLAPAIYRALALPSRLAPKEEHGRHIQKALFRAFRKGGLASTILPHLHQTSGNTQQPLWAIVDACVCEEFLFAHLPHYDKTTKESIALTCLVQCEKQQRADDPKTCGILHHTLGVIEVLLQDDRFATKHFDRSSVLIDTCMDVLEQKKNDSLITQAMGILVRCSKQKLLGKHPRLESICERLLLDGLRRKQHRRRMLVKLVEWMQIDDPTSALWLCEVFGISIDSDSDADAHCHDDVKVSDALPISAEDDDDDESYRDSNSERASV